MFIVTSRKLLEKKICAWLHLFQNDIYTDLPPTFSEQFLRTIRGDISKAAALILHQIKLNLQLSHCAVFF